MPSKLRPSQKCSHEQNIAWQLDLIEKVALASPNYEMWHKLKEIGAKLDVNLWHKFPEYYVYTTDKSTLMVGGKRFNYMTDYHASWSDAARDYLVHYCFPQELKDA